MGQHLSNLISPLKFDLSSRIYHNVHSCYRKFHPHSPSPISTLPPELIEEILSLLEQRDLLSTCRVSKVFYMHSVGSLYREISAESSAQAARCLKTLVEKEGLGMHVRQVAIQQQGGRIIPTIHSRTRINEKTVEEADYGTTVEAFRRLTHLESLNITASPDTEDSLSNVYKSALENSHFPSLVHLCHPCHLDKNLIAFLNRHPTLMRLELDRENIFNPGPIIVPGDAESLYRLPPNTSPGNLFARLPSLRYFTGEALYLPFVAKESALCGATLSWYNEVEDAIVDVIRTLEEASRESLVYLSCRRRGWSLDLLRAVAEKLPDLLALELVDVMMVQAFPSEDVLNTITELIGQFTSLRKFTFGPTAAWYEEPLSRQSMDCYFRAVTTWGMICPSLNLIGLYKSADWYRVVDDFWVPDGANDDAMAWFEDAVLSILSPSSTSESARFPDIMNKDRFKHWRREIVTKMAERDPESGVLTLVYVFSQIVGPVGLFLHLTKGLDEEETVEASDREEERLVERLLV